MPSEFNDLVSVTILNKNYLRDIRTSMKGLCSSQRLDEAIAAGFGANTYKGLLTKIDADDWSAHTIDDQRFSERVAEFGATVEPGRFRRAAAECLKSGNTMFPQYDNLQLTPADFASIDDIASTKQHADDLRETIEKYIDVADRYNAKAFDQYEEAKDVCIDDIPYGEEVARLEDAPNKLEELSDRLDLGLNPSFPSEKITIKSLIQIQDAIDEIDADLEECTPLPPSEDFIQDYF